MASGEEKKLKEAIARLKAKQRAEVGRDRDRDCGLSCRASGLVQQGTT